MMDRELFNSPEGPSLAENFAHATNEFCQKEGFHLAAHIFCELAIMVCDRGNAGPETRKLAEALLGVVKADFLASLD